VEVSDNVDITRAVFLDDHAALVTTLNQREECIGDAEFAVANINGRGNWTLMAGDEMIASGDELQCQSNEQFSVSISDGHLRIKGQLTESKSFILSWQ